MNTPSKKFVLAVSGASGSIYAREAIRALLGLGAQVHLVFSPVGKQVWIHELGSTPADFIKTLPAELAERLIVEQNSDLGARIASGSFRHDGMLVIPCSMKSLAGIANGYAGGLIERAADVALKERFPLVLVARETPLSLIHLENMAKVTRAGAVVLPACPGFYHGDDSFEALVNFVVGKALDSLGQTEHGLFKRWKSGEDHA
jgi:4-hydroxy-3-polyprenylbenzoate decarboxylase